MSELSYKVIVGLEIHVQLRTKTKMFCSCALGFGEEANSRVCPVCLGMPGSLPVMNGLTVVPIDKARECIAGFLCVLDFHGPADTIEGVDLEKLTRAEWLSLAQLVRMRTASQPMGPYLTTPEEVGDPYDCMVYMKLNDERVARYWSNVVLHGFERTISHLSQFMTVLPGTIIQLGMMSSYSISFSKGDAIPQNSFFGVDIERVGYLKSPIVDERGL